jgi:hypothetical protein
MSEHPPRHDPNPARPVDPYVDPSLIDLVAGDPPVPITVWRTARTAADSSTVGARLAYRLVSTYSRPGEAVVDLTDGHALIGACAAGGRRHHRAWFTDVSSLIIGPATPPATDADDTDDPGLPDGPDPTDLRAWFGDDLTDPDLPPHGGIPVTLPPDASVQGATSLVVACWPLDPQQAPNRVRLAWLLTACAELLRPGGCLVLVVAVPGGAAATPEDFSPLVTAAARVGLGYLQHIVAVGADTDGDAFVYHVTDEELLTLAHHATWQRWSVAHLRVHADLLVLSQQQPPTSRRRAQGGGHRG